MPTPELTIIGGGLAGCEAAWQAARAGVDVVLFEMKPQRFSPAHHSPLLGELVCSNSLRGAALANAVGCLKEELRRCGSLFMAAADATAVPAGGALAVDREAFAAFLTEKIENHPRIRVCREEVTELPAQGTVIVASGPLTSESLSATIARLTGADHLYFYDAIAPIVEADSIDFSRAWRASRYGKGGDDYVNCPLSREEYFAFVEELRRAEKVPARAFEREIHFEGCMPIEVMAERGEMTLAFGPMKPVGLPDPRTGREPFAVVQLRQDNRHATLYNLVGFQTKLTYPEQRRLFRTIPGLEQARFARLGSMHRNTFVNAPACLDRSLQLRQDPRIFFAGQITGVEGYVESAATGLIAGLLAAGRQLAADLPLPPPTTACGALLAHLADSSAEKFQPMNINYGLFPPLPQNRGRRGDRRLRLAERALEDLGGWWSAVRATLPVPVDKA
jgi:methylenetetrahydrofolate--tRNA-(uracil-5-)-methyltransferase